MPRPMKLRQQHAIVSRTSTVQQSRRSHPTHEDTLEENDVEDDDDGEDDYDEDEDDDEGFDAKVGGVSI